MNRIIEFSSPKRRRVRGTNIKIGTTLYAVQDTHTRLYFIWAYTDRPTAEWIATRVHPDSPADISANWRHDKAQLTPTEATSQTEPTP